MLFFGNIVKNVDNYRELQDCALRIIPNLKRYDDFVNISSDFYNNEGYYNSSNMYSKVGYFNKEYYRFGVVFIYNNGTLSNVYNTSGFDLTGGSQSIEYPEYPPILQSDSNTGYYTRNYIKIDDNGWIITEGNENISNLNSKGVCRLNYKGSYSEDTLFYINF